MSTPQKGEVCFYKDEQGLPYLDLEESGEAVAIMLMEQERKYLRNMIEWQRLGCHLYRLYKETMMVLQSARYSRPRRCGERRQCLVIPASRTTKGW